MTRDDGQIVFVDTPGVHKPGHLLNRRMMAAVHDAMLSVDVVVLMRDASVSTGNGDRFVLDLVKEAAKPSILVLNKIDKIKNKTVFTDTSCFSGGKHSWLWFRHFIGELIPCVK